MYIPSVFNVNTYHHSLQEMEAVTEMTLHTSNNTLGLVLMISKQQAGHETAAWLFTFPSISGASDQHVSHNVILHKMQYYNTNSTNTTDYHTLITNLH